MTAEQQQLIDDVVSLTGTAAPAWADESSPTLQHEAPRTLYLVGMIGGKDVGKSSLVNAILGQEIAVVSNHGEGTSRALAYVHEDDAAAAAALLDSAANGAFDLVRHRIPQARGRVLLDLPDVDSIWDAHVDLTRRMLRSMLFPVWVQSVEKYADRGTLALLARVAEGNAPDNFAFVLTKVDQLARRHGDGAVAELKADFSVRVAKACRIEGQPAVFGIDGLSRSGFDLQGLRDKLLEARSPAALDDARRLAERQQARTFQTWLSQQRIDEQLSAAKRAFDEADAQLASRVIEPMLDRLSAEPVSPAMIEPTVRARIGYWPIISAMDAVLGPMLAVFRARAEAWSDRPLAGRQISQHLRGVFAALAQRQPRLLALYEANPLWETQAADRAAEALEERLGQAAFARRQTLLAKASTPSLPIRLVAWILTIGAALWFPIVQPVLEIVLQQDIRHFTTATLLLIVQMLGATYLLRSVGFLAIYYFALWIWLRWHTVRRVERTLKRTPTASDPAAALTAWADNLLLPLRRNVERLQSLSDRIAAAGHAPRPATLTAA